MKYQAKVTEIGGMVQELAEDGNLLIIFNEDVQDPDLKDISIAHTVTELKEDIVAGDVLTIGDKKLKDLGHCTIKFDGDTKANLPGELHVDGLVPEVKVGDVITFE